MNIHQLMTIAFMALLFLLTTASRQSINTKLQLLQNLSTQPTLFGDDDVNDNDNENGTTSHPPIINAKLRYSPQFLEQRQRIMEYDLKHRSAKPNYEHAVFSCLTKGLDYIPLPREEWKEWTPYPPGYCGRKSQQPSQQNVSMDEMIAGEFGIKLQPLPNTYHTREQCLAHGYVWVPSYVSSCWLCSDKRFVGYKCDWEVTGTTWH